MSELEQRVANAIQFAAQEDWDLQIPTDEGALVLARAAITEITKLRAAAIPENPVGTLSWGVTSNLVNGLPRNWRGGRL